MSGNRGVAYIEPGVVEVHTIDYPRLALGATHYSTIPNGSKTYSTRPVEW